MGSFFSIVSRTTEYSMDSCALYFGPHFALRNPPATMDGEESHPRLSLYPPVSISPILIQSLNSINGEVNHSVATLWDNSRHIRVPCF